MGHETAAQALYRHAREAAGRHDAACTALGCGISTGHAYAQGQGAPDAKVCRMADALGVRVVYSPGAGWVVEVQT